MSLNLTTVSDVYEFLNKIAPFDEQCSWDNSGLIVGDLEKTVKKIGVVLDITSDAVKKAHESGVDLIVSHHPVIFHPIKNVGFKSPVCLLAKYEISAICAHTSLDSADGGVSDVLAGLLGAINPVPICREGEAAVCRMFDVEEQSAECFAKLVAKRLSSFVRMTCPDKMIRKVAVCAGSGAEFIKEVKNAGCDAFVTGDASHHDFVDAEQENVSLMAAGHFETENPIVRVLYAKLKERFNADVVIIDQTSPIKYIY